MRILLNQKYGLGNQLFQYAAGLYFADKYGASLEIIREHEEAATSYGHPRSFLLDNFRIETPVRDRTLLDRILRSKSRSVAIGAAPIRKLFGVYSHDPHFLIVGEFQPSLPVRRGTRRIYLHGHFQVHQYAQAMEQRLRKELTFREPPTGKNFDTLNQIQTCECPISLHLRRGDYVVGWSGRNLLPMTYYDDAIAVMHESHPDATFFVFSDEMPFARESFHKLERVVFVDNNSAVTAHEDIRLMSACRHHILANSTFSWWGAWLNPNPHKVVLAPDPWHVSDPHPDLIPPTWRQLPR